LVEDSEFRSSVVRSQRALVDDIYSVESVTRQYLELVA
jgi:hypothetical protein